MPTQFDPAVNDGYDYQILKWTGATASKNIGTAFITVGISIEPVAQMRGILKVSPRGSYEGTFAALRQCRKSGMMLEFFSPEDA